MPADALLLEGRLAVQAALEAGNRPVSELLIDESKQFDRRLSRILHLARGADVAVTALPRVELSQMADGNSHGGVLARVGERRYKALDDLLPADRPAFIVMLDGIEDPYNFGGALRALYAAGVDGIVLRPRNWSSAAAIVGRASAGASERLPIAIADSAGNAADFYRRQRLLIAATSKSADAQSIYTADLAQPLFLLIGGERRGITRSFLDQADLLLQIPYGRDFGAALGAVGAAAVIAFEVMRQRRHK